MRTAISVMVTFVTLFAMNFSFASTPHRTMRQSFSTGKSQEIIARKNPKKPKGTPYRGSGRRGFM